MKTYHDIAGDGGSDVLGQIRAQEREIDDALAGVRRIVAVGSGKGGVGKSTVTMGLARALADSGARVAILDADLNGPSQARMAGLEGRPWVPGDRGLVPPRRPDGIAVLSMGSVLPDGVPLDFETVSKGEQQTWRATRELATFAQVLAGTDWRELDVLLLDLPPGTERTVQFAETLTGIFPEPPAGSPSPSSGQSVPRSRLAFLLVTAPSAVSRGVVARSITALAALEAPVLGYVENMAGYLCPDCGEVQPLFPDPNVPLDAPCLGRLPFDPELARLCDAGWPTAPLPPALGDLEGLAQSLVDHPVDAQSTPAESESPESPQKEVPR